MNHTAQNATNNEHYIGLDLGQAQDYSALALLEKIGEGEEYTANLKFIKRFDLGTSYPDIVDYVKKSMEVFPGDTSLIVDKTGVGAPVVDMFKRADLYPYSIYIHGGENVTKRGMEYHVPKRDLVANLQVFFQTKVLKMSSSMPLVPALHKELLNFKVKISEKGHDSYSAWREGIHDDLVLAVAMACWVMKRRCNTPLLAWL